MNANLFLKNKMLQCAAYNCNSSSKNNSDKTFFILREIYRTGKAWTAAINQKQGTLYKNVFIQASIIFKKFVSIKAGYCRNNYFAHHVPTKENS